MDSKIKIRIKKQSQSQLLISIIIFMPFLFGTLFDLLKLPTALKYLLDVSWVYLLALIIINYKRIENAKGYRLLYLWVTAFFLFTGVIYIFNYQSFLYYLWGFRNNFRFYIAFFAFIVFLKSEDVKIYFKLFDVLFWINAVVCFVQYFIINIRGDYLGGVFGIEQGCNGYINIFFVIVAARTIISYLNKRESLFNSIIKCGTILIISALAELKFFFIEFVIIVLIAIVFTDFSFRKFLVVFCGLIGLWIGINLLIGVFSDSSDIFTWEKIINMASSDKGYTSSGDLNRLTTIPVISNRILTSIPKKVLGLGLGNCDMATYSFLNTPFFTQYSYLRYHWFSTSFVFLETGYIGLIMFFGFFVAIFALAFKKVCSTAEEKIHRQMALIVSLCCILIGIYNASLRTEAGYMAYFVLALPFIEYRKSIE